MPSCLKFAELKTPLGAMNAAGDEKALYLLEFADQEGLERLEKKSGCKIVVGETASIRSIRAELELYFNGKLKAFKTEVGFLGTPFQTGVWQALRQIPYGKTISYMQLAHLVGCERGSRAVAGANGANLLAIIAPCHRVINANGALGGYNGGISRKKWLLAHEGDD